MTVKIDPQVVRVLPSVNIEALLVNFVSDAIAHLAPEHHLVTPIVIVHNVLKGGHVRFHVDQVEVNHFGCCYLDADVAFDVEDEAAHFNFVVECPLLYLVVYIKYLLEEQDFARASENSYRKTCGSTWRLTAGKATVAFLLVLIVDAQDGKEVYRFTVENGVTLH